MLAAIGAIIGRDLRLALRQGLDSLLAVVFFVLACVLFPFGVGPAPETLARIAAGVLWVAALLAALLSLERLFQADYEDGSLDLLALGPAPLPAIAAAKIAAHWLTTAVPLIAAAPVLALILNLPPAAFSSLVLALVLGTPTLSLIGGVGAALVLGARRGGAAGAPGPAALHPGSDLWRCRRRRQPNRLGRPAAPLYAGGPAAGGAGAGAVGRGSGLAPSARLTCRRARALLEDSQGRSPRHRCRMSGGRLRACGRADACVCQSHFRDALEYARRHGWAA